MAGKKNRKYTVVSVDKGWVGVMNGSDKLRDNFSVYEFACSDDTQVIPVHTEHLNKLQSLRLRIGKPLKLTSAFRSYDYNKSIGGASKSQHVLGTATDLALPSGMTMKEFKAHCEAIGFDGIGVYYNSNFIHVDSRGKHARWTD